MSRLTGCSYCQMDSGGNHERSCPCHPDQRKPMAVGIPHGWLCSSCGASLAPWVNECPHCAPPPKITVTWKEESER